MSMIVKQSLALWGGDTDSVCLEHVHVALVDWGRIALVSTTATGLVFLTVLENNY